MTSAPDTLVRLPEAEAVFAALAGPKRLVRFARAGHQPCRDVDPPMWAEAVETEDPASEAAARHGVGAEQTTRNGDEAYASWPKPAATAFPWPLA